MKFTKCWLDVWSPEDDANAGDFLDELPCPFCGEHSLHLDPPEDYEDRSAAEAEFPLEVDYACDGCGGKFSLRWHWGVRAPLILRFEKGER